MTAAAPTIRSRRRHPLSERLIDGLLFLSGAAGILTTIGIVVVLLAEAGQFFAQVSPIEFFTGTRWSPLIRPNAFGVLPLVSGTLLVSGIGLLIGVPLGLLAAIYLAEYARPWVRNVLKPALEVIAGIPTIVLGFFALNFLTPEVLKRLLGAEIGTYSALAGGIVVGILITPLIASLSEDALRAVPRGLREGAFAMGATRFEVVRKVVFPAALSGVMAAVILAASRAIGETMAVVLAAGTTPRLTLDPTDSVQTMTAYIVQISTGDTPAGSVQFYSLFAVGATLFVVTFGLTLLSDWVVARFRNTYQ